jgi:hypothetical protein
MMKAPVARRRSTLISLAIVLLLGLSTKLYGGPGAQWVSHSLSGVRSVVFWCLFIFLFTPEGTSRE